MIVKLTLLASCISTLVALPAFAQAAQGEPFSHCQEMINKVDTQIESLAPGPRQMRAQRELKAGESALRAGREAECESHLMNVRRDLS